jgi:hypothetical protein
MIRQASLWSCVIFTVAGCGANTTSSLVAPDAAESFADGATSRGRDTEGSDAASPSSSRGGSSSDDAPSTNDPSLASSASSEALTSDALSSAGTDGGVSSDVSCDVRRLTCKRAAPACDYGYVPRIIDNCYAECVRIDDCVCSGADACPERERYTCNNSRQRCTPYLR